MEDISDLVKEAKPLYLARKKRNKRLKVGVVTLFCAAVMFSFVPYQNKDAVAYSWDLGDVENEVLSYVENFGLPVDDYGLLRVS